MFKIVDKSSCHQNGSLDKIEVLSNLKTRKLFYYCCECHSKCLLEVEEIDDVIEGSWSGYEITFKYDNEMYMVQTKQGVRGINVKVYCHLLQTGWSFYKDQKLTKEIEILKIYKEV